MYYTSISFAILLLISQTSLLFGQKKQPSPTNPPIVQTETCWTYPIQNARPSTTGQKTSLTNYHTNGTKNKLIVYAKDQSIAYEYAFDYSANKQEMYWTSYENKRIQSQVAYYDKAKNLISLVRYKIDGSKLDSSLYTYLNNQKSTEVYYDNDNNKVYTIAYSYDNKTNSARELYTHHLTQEKFIGALDLDTNKKLVSYTQYKTSGPLYKNIEYIRDEKGRVLEKKVFDANAQLQTKEVYEYESDKTKYSLYLGQEQVLTEHLVYEYNYYKS